MAVRLMESFMNLFDAWCYHG